MLKLSSLPEVLKGKKWFYNALGRGRRGTGRALCRSAKGRTPTYPGLSRTKGFKG
jgi:hypothetical protein